MFAFGPDTCSGASQGASTASLPLMVHASSVGHLRGVARFRLGRRFGVVVLTLGAMLGLSACAGKTTGATNINDGSATLQATASCSSGERCTWYWEYWRSGSPRSDGVLAPGGGPVSGPTGSVTLSTRITNLSPDTTYLWVLCGSADGGADYSCVGPNGTPGSTTADPPPDYATFTTAFPGTLAEGWNGSSWTIRASPNPGGENGGVLNGVSCTSPSACTAVGTYNNGGSIETLAERWDGTSWTIQSTPNPSGSNNSVLDGVSCTSPSACTAVGQYDSAGTNVTLAERWDGTSWTIQTTPNPGDSASSVLSGVSCTSATACTAVGSGAGAALAERWDGTSWTIQAIPSPSGATASGLSGVSCTSAIACTAIGGYSSPGLSGTLAERWDGTSWTIQTTPNPSGAGLSGVSCASATACTAVGVYNGSGNRQPLAESWDGTSWTIQTMPNPTSGHYGSFLSGVSCTSQAACTAVGTLAPGQGTVAERWNGTSWTIQATPNDGSASRALNGVSCASADGCTAVGAQ